jgi:hypothetical protein
MMNLTSQHAVEVVLDCVTWDGLSWSDGVVQRLYAQQRDAHCGNALGAAAACIVRVHILPVCRIRKSEKKHYNMAVEVSGLMPVGLNACVSNDTFPSRQYAQAAHVAERALVRVGVLVKWVCILAKLHTMRPHPPNLRDQ